MNTELDKAWEEYHTFEEKWFRCVGNGCDDYRDIPDWVFKKRRELKEKYEKLYERKD